MKLSVITVTYNDRDALSKTIASVKTQSSTDFEFIVIDGASSDGSLEVIRANRDIIDRWVSEPDKGIYNAMNKGIDAAKGEYCIFMNAGDAFHNNEVIARFCGSGPTADIVCGNAMILEDPVRRKWAFDEITCDTLFASSICHQSAFIRTSLLWRYRYDESLKIVADRKFFFQALVLGGCSYATIDVDVVDYDINGFSARNRFLSEMEWTSVLESLLPSRILKDYGRHNSGPLFGSTPYEKLFLEIGRRRYRGPVYRLTVLYLRLVSIFKDSANFIKSFPSKI